MDIIDAILGSGILAPRVKELEEEMVTVTNTGDVYIGSQLIRKVLTQTEYDALTSYDPKVDYLIVPAST